VLQEEKEQKRTVEIMPEGSEANLRGDQRSRKVLKMGGGGEGTIWSGDGGVRDWGVELVISPSLFISGWGELGGKPPREEVWRNPKEGGGPHS